MYGYKIVPSGIPETVYACTAHVMLEVWENFNNDRYIEIGIYQSESRIVCYGDKKIETGSEPGLMCIVGNDKIKTLSPPGVLSNHLYVSVHYPELEFEPCEITAEDLEGSDYLLLPLVIPHLSDDVHDRISRLILSYIKCNTSKSLADRMNCHSIWNQLLVLIDGTVRAEHSVSQTSPEHLYVSKLDRIISRRYGEHLTLNKIAEEFGITPNYLSCIYSKITGIRFTEALLRQRMQHARELASDGTLTVAEIGARIGLRDESYLRKKFKQFFGVSITECRRIDRQVTRLHSLNI